MYISAYKFSKETFSEQNNLVLHMWGGEWGGYVQTLIFKI